MRSHIAILDGWRALSIILVLSAHWLPVGSHALQLNDAIGASGMALFFCLSGFLITNFLHSDSRVGVFMIKRVARIVPLAWAAMLILIIVNRSSGAEAIANLLFISNLPPATLLPGGEHLWSLCVEMQFYLLAAVAVALAGSRALYLIPLACFAITALRISNDEVISIVTWYRIDEILAGGVIALVWINGWGKALLTRLPAWTPILFLIALPVVSLPALGPASYLRPYIAMLAVGLSLYRFPEKARELWTGKAAAYVAEISYAIYVIHGMLTATPLGGAGESKFVKYALRPPLLFATLLFAHLSTRYYERLFTRLAGRFIASRTSS